MKSRTTNTTDAIAKHTGYQKSNNSLTRLRLRSGVIAITALLSLVLSACGADNDVASPEPADPAEPVETETDGDTADDEEVVVIRAGVYAYMTEVWDWPQIVANYEDANPNVKIDWTPVPGTEMADLPAVVQRYALEARSGEATYDVLIGPTPWLEVAPLAAADALEPIENYLSDDVLDDIFASARAESTFEDGLMYGLPIFNDVVGFLYRNDLLEEATGSSDAPETWDELLVYSSQVDSALGPDVAGFGADWPHAHRLFLPIFVSMTDEPYVDGRWNLEDDAALRTLQLISDLYEYMPENAYQDLGSSSTFQAGQLAMSVYWQAQYRRAEEAGIPAESMTLTGTPRGERNASIFWNATGILLGGSEKHEEATRFLVEGIMQDAFANEEALNTMKIPPYYSVVERVELPEWAPDLFEELENGEPIPMTPLFLNHMQPIYREEVERMLLQDQSVEETRTNMLERIVAAAEGS